MNKLASHLLLLSAIFMSVFITGCASNIASRAASPPIHQAALTGDVEKMKQLLASGANPNQVDESGFSTIHWAAANTIGNNRRMIEILIRAGADPNAKQGTAQMTPLQFASNAEAAQALIDNGARLDTRDVSQSTPLHSTTSVEIARVLLDNGADINAKNMSGLTPLQNLKHTLNYFENTPTYNTIRQQYQQTIQLLESYQGSTLVNNTSPAKNNQTMLSSMSVSSSATAAAVIQEKDDIDKAEQQAKALEEKQACPMYDFDWFYTGKDCKDELAHGQGEAINPYESLRFEGKILEGKPIEGTLYKDKDATYEGKFRNGLAHGTGLCFYQGAPEECRYYKGERIDSLHKQRQEFERQQQILSEQRQSDLDYKASSESYSTSSDVDYGAYQAPRYNTSYEEDRSDPITDAVQDAVTEELIDQGTKMLFDQLF